MFARDPTVQTGGHSGWVLAAKRVPEVMYTHHHLRPGLSYVFIVRAENSHGLSLPSDPSEATSTLAAPGDMGPGGSRGWEIEEARARLGGHVVELSHAQALSSTQVKLTWEVRPTFLLLRVKEGGRATVLLIDGALQCFSFIVSKLYKNKKIQSNQLFCFVLLLHFVVN